MSQSTSPQAPTPKGWYPINDQQEGYWNGSAWTGQVRAHTAIPEQYAPERTAAAGLPPTTTPATAARLKSPWYKRWWALAAAALVVLVLGIGIGAASAGSADPKNSPEYQALSAQLVTARGNLQSAQGALSSTKAQLKQAVGNLPAREAAVTKAEAALKARQTTVAKREAAVRGAEKAVLKREKAVGLAEAQVAANTIPGDGVFQVGVDMKAGTYKSSGMTGCYYAVNADANGNNILSNNLTDGPARVSVSKGQYFETSSCAKWILQR